MNLCKPFKQTIVGVELKTSIKKSCYVDQKGTSIKFHLIWQQHFVQLPSSKCDICRRNVLYTSVHVCSSWAQDLYTQTQMSSTTSALMPVRSTLAMLSTTSVPVLSVWLVLSTILVPLLSVRQVPLTNLVLLLSVWLLLSTTWVQLLLWPILSHLGDLLPTNTSRWSMSVASWLNSDSERTQSARCFEWQETTWWNPLISSITLTPTSTGTTRWRCTTQTPFTNQHLRHLFTHVKRPNKKSSISCA